MMRGAIRGACVAAALVTAAAFGQGASRVILRGGADPPDAIVESVSAAGVRLNTDGRVSVLSLDRVADVQGAKAPEFAPLASIAADAWRARVRIERGDLGGAEPIFERLFTRLETEQGATPALVASGLLRCRVARGARAAAVRPWLALLRSGESETAFAPPESTLADRSPETLVDPATGLCPALPPIWAPGAPLQSLASLGPTPNEAERVATLRTLYSLSARAELGEQATLPPRPSGDEGLELVWDIVASRAGAEAQRAAAVASLASLVEGADTPAWKECWARVALGRALLRAPDRETQLLGVLHLMHAPARFADSLAPLAVLALEEVALYHSVGGDADLAAKLRRRAEEVQPGVPAGGAR